MGHVAVTGRTGHFSARARDRVTRQKSPSVLLCFKSAAPLVIYPCNLRGPVGLIGSVIAISAADIALPAQRLNVDFACWVAARRAAQSFTGNLMPAEYAGNELRHCLGLDDASFVVSKIIYLIEWTKKANCVLLLKVEMGPRMSPNGSVTALFATGSPCFRAPMAIAARLRR